MRIRSRSGIPFSLAVWLVALLVVLEEDPVSR
jgi:hypothetical protein